LHGIFQDYTVYNSEFLPKLNYYIANKSISPVILVTPNGANKYGGSFYTNSYVSGNWEDFIAEDVVQHVEKSYRVLYQPESRGLSGFSMGGFGTVIIAMKHPSVFSSICLIDAAKMDLDLTVNQGSGKLAKENIIAAAKINQYSSTQSQGIRTCFSAAVAFAPDSTAKPILGRLPFTGEGELIDSIWQKWLMYDPISLLPTYKDSLLKLNSFQIYVADQANPIQANESFHQVLLDLGIEHGYEIYPGGHDARPVLNDLLSFFSEHLTGIVPTVRTSSDYFLESTDTLVLESDMDGAFYIVPAMSSYTLDSILKHQVLTADVMADMKYEYSLSGLDFGRYLAYAICNDSIVSNIPEEFCVVPDTSLPKLEITSDTIRRGEPIRVSCDKDGTLCLLKCGWWCEWFSKPSEILENFIDSMAIEADDTVTFSTESLALGSYQIYGFDQYGIVSKPLKFQIIQAPVSIDEFGGNPSEIEIFPNPVNGILNLQTNRYGLYELSISSINGQLLYSTQTEGTSHQIDLSSFQKGVYFITIRSEDFITTRKIIKL
jgi:S-formylglutathione hydrolase FrmB